MSVVSDLMQQYQKHNAELSSISPDENPDQYRAVLFELLAIEQEIETLEVEDEQDI